MTCYKAAIAIRPDFSIAHGNLGACLLDLGHFPEAITELKQAVQLEVQSPTLYSLHHSPPTSFPLFFFISPT